VLRAVADEREEAEAVARGIEQLLGGASFHAFDSRAVDGRGRAEHQLSFADFAVLYRTSAQAAAVGEALARCGFPYQQRSHARLAETAGVPQILAALGDRGMLDADVAAVADADPVSVAELLAKAVGLALSALPAASPADARSEAGVEMQSDADLNRAEAIAAIRSAADMLGPLASRCGADLDRFLDEVALGAEVDTRDPRADRITLLTLHAAKGLEFPVVFIVGCDDGLLPLRPWHGADIDYAEERRLLFVGMTRATTRLTLLTAAKRMMRGEVTECSPSPFLSSIDPALLDRSGDGASGQRARRRDRVRQATLF
jgi:DNA helicase-2/ATP-dependent DNA helicase PcrA